MKKRNSKQIFAETLVELSKHKPLDKITVQQIVDESGLSVQTFYNHFHDKYDLILWVHKSKYDELLAKLGKDGYTFRDLTLDNIRFYRENKDFMCNALTNTHGQDSYLKASQDNAYAVMRRYILEHRGLKSLPRDIDFYLKMYCMTGPYMYAEWAFHMEETPPEIFAGYVEGVMPEALKEYLLT